MAQLMSFEEARNTLKKYREDQIRDSDLVVSLWEDVISDKCSRLGDELWLVYEQVCTAALDCQRYDIAEICITSLDNKFPKSIRVRRLQGMFYEAREEFSEAEEEYKSILEKDETNMYARKRQVATLKARNKIGEAIQKLNEYLKSFMTDSEAWNELCDLYLSQHDYTNAAFCLEELLMSNPHNHLFHQKYAEIRYTQGGNENMELARSYFAQAVKLNPNNVRALNGLFLSASTLAVTSSKGARDKQLNLKYATWAAEQIQIKYQTQQPESQLKDTRIRECLEKHLDSLQSA
ncbi:ER membrane protein complex subunit 2 [Plakobranchus ocellatus]|uniref:ER membrane protein complex subunit 2 n=1 Tax=Plakobranchus ocellatus TaxID=259542 RepID=A0AAV4B531_9GAST|nr:ER membrane protein complex subunit 2 [Plakobranchus ocellatus]